MKRYLVFCFQPYDALGGMDDLEFSTDDLEEAMRFLLDDKGEAGHIWDTVANCEVLWKGSYQHRNNEGVYFSTSIRLIPSKN